MAEGKERRYIYSFSSCTPRCRMSGLQPWGQRVLSGLWGFLHHRTSVSAQDMLQKSCPLWPCGPILILCRLLSHNFRNQPPPKFIAVTIWSWGLQSPRIKLPCPHRAPKPGLESRYHQLVHVNMTIIHNSLSTVLQSMGHRPPVPASAGGLDKKCRSLASCQTCATKTL